MIKLIASDLDGTLIPEGTQTIDPDFWGELEKLLEQGYLFYAASGRQYANMRRLFDGYADRMGFISENGAIVTEKEQVIFVDELPRKLMVSVAEDMIRFPETEICLSGVRACYIRPRTDWFADQIENVLKNATERFEDPASLDDQIVKASVYIHDFDKNVSFIQSFLREKYGAQADFVTAGNGWLDMIMEGSGKGKALEFVMERQGISPEEVMVFGDNQNDISMLKLVSNSYAVESAKPEARACASHTCESVSKILREFLKM